MRNCSGQFHRIRFVAVAGLAITAAIFVPAVAISRALQEPVAESAPPRFFEGLALLPSEATAERIGQCQAAGQQIVLRLGCEEKEAGLAAARALELAGMEIGYFVEIANCPALAATHPEWMASLQGHPEWRRLFPEFPAPAVGEVVKTWPWVPVFNREAFDAHVTRVTELLKELPAPKRLWLNDIQGAPSACGCGHPLCRWTADYGPLKTATTIGDSAPAKFVQAVAALVPGCEVIPILTTECEQEDKADVCAGVGCYEGICWKAWSRQLAALDPVAPRIGVACFYREFGRDLPRYGGEAAWIATALDSFSAMPPQRGGTAISAHRLIAVVQGWNVTSEQVAAQLDVARRAGAAGTLLLAGAVDQSWEPRTCKLR